MAGGKGKSAGGKSSGGKTSAAAEGPKKQQSHSARAGLQVRIDCIEPQSIDSHLHISFCSAISALNSIHACLILHLRHHITTRCLPTDAFSAGFLAELIDHIFPRGKKLGKANSQKTKHRAQTQYGRNRDARIEINTAYPPSPYLKFLLTNHLMQLGPALDLRLIARADGIDLLMPP
jgi:hypothetical protein